MRFLFKMAFWLSLVLVLLRAAAPPTPKMPVNAGDAMSAAKSAVDDMRSFCERQAQACTVGSQAAVAIGHRAQAGAKMLYDFLTEQLGPGVDRLQDAQRTLDLDRVDTRKPHGSAANPARRSRPAATAA
jgi:hypothetical protein